MIGRFYKLPFSFVEPEGESAAMIRDADGQSVAMLMWPCHPPEDTDAAVAETYAVARAFVASLDRLAALEAERAAGGARVVELGNLLCLADNLLMDAIGAFPLHGHTMRDGCILIRAETGEHYDTRQARGTAALAKQEPGS